VLRCQIIHGADDVIANILIRNHISDKPLMNYENYERRVVENWGIVLHGWPLKKVVNPAKAGARRDLDQLHEALMNGTCAWVKLTKEELVQRIENNCAREAAGEEVYKHRKVSTHKKAARSRDAIDDDEEEGEEGSD
jgi:hypothetical protein